MSTRFLPVAAVACVVLSPLADAAAPADDVQDLIFFDEARPIFLRLHIEVDGKPYKQHWSEVIARLHKYLDTNDDGLLGAGERAVWLSQLGQSPGRGRANSPAPEGRSTDGVATVADLAEFLRPVFGPIQFQVVGRSEPEVETLFKVLDRDGDTKLSPSELQSADATLMKYDRDEDETIGARELLPYQNPFSGDTRVAAPPSSTSPFVALGPREPRAPLARRLFASYDKHGGPDDGPGKDNRLQRDEIGLDPAAFASADQDDDGSLDADEVAHLVASPPPSLELRVRIARNGPTSESSLAAVETPEHPSALASAVRKGTGNELAIMLDTDLIAFHLPRQRRFDVRRFYRRQFRAADGDNNQYLDRQEVGNNGVFGQLFTLMDRDGDGKVFELEMSALIDIQVEAAESRTLLSVTDQGRSLFQILDDDRDRRLAIRELRAAAKQFALWDRNHDGTIALEEIPRHYHLEFGEGSSPLLINFAAQGFMNDPGAVPNAAAGMVPSWFRRMDLNLDGDVSTREFLGTRDQFHTLDTDNDGLIDPSEASKAR